MRRLSILCLAVASCLACSTAKRACPPQRLLSPALVPKPAMELCPPLREYPFTNLVLQGGGVKGIAYAGAFQVLEEQRILERIERVAGTSAGSIAALLVSLGYTPGEIQRLLLDLDFEQFEDGGGLCGIFRVFRRFGFFTGDFALEWLRCRVGEKTGDPHATFADLAPPRFRELFVVATDLSRTESEVFSRHSHPDMEVALAVRMSMSIPLFFASVRGEGGDVFVDGGVMRNFPIAQFDGDEPNPATLGLRLADLGAAPVDLAIDDLDAYARALFEALLDAQVTLLESNRPDLVRTVAINDLGIPTTDFRLTEAQKRQLIEQGVEATCRYLRDWRPETLPQSIAETRRP